MATTVLQVRMDEDLKNEASELFEKLELDIPTAIRIFFKRAVTEKGIPFELREPTAVYNVGSKASSEVYELFVHSGLLKMLQDDYEDLHGVGKEYLMDFFDKWFSGEKSKDTHHLVKSILIPQVVSMLMETYSITENEAIRIVYTSPTGKCLDDDPLGLYGQSALYICGLIENDIQNNLELLKNIMRVGMLL